MYPEPPTRSQLWRGHPHASSRLVGPEDEHNEEHYPRDEQDGDDAGRHGVLFHNCSSRRSTQRVRTRERAPLGSGKEVGRASPTSSDASSDSFARPEIHQRSPRRRPARPRIDQARTRRTSSTPIVARHEPDAVAADGALQAGSSTDQARYGALLGQRHPRGRARHLV
jgi:hypothetical protein